MADSIFPICSLSRLARLLGLSKLELYELAERAPELYRPATLYVPYKEPRRISVPTHHLASIQRRILCRIFVAFRPHDCSYGGIKGKTARENAATHLNKLFRLKIDVRKFYPNVHHCWVQSFFQNRLGCIPPVASTLRRLLTLKGGLPQGTSTSPALADQILKPIDTRLNGAFHPRGITYTRWVDDITISADFSLSSYVSLIARIFRSYGLRIHERGDKAPKQYRPGEELVVTGLSVGKSWVSIPDYYIQTIKRELELASQFAEGYAFEPPPYGKESYWGSIQYVRRFSKRKARELQCVFDAIDWHKLEPLALPGKRGRVVFAGN